MALEDFESAADEPLDDGLAHVDDLDGLDDLFDLDDLVLGALSTPAPAAEPAPLPGPEAATPASGPLAGPEVELASEPAGTASPASAGAAWDDGAEPAELDGDDDLFDFDEIAREALAADADVTSALHPSIEDLLDEEDAAEAAHSGAPATRAATAAAAARSTAAPRAASDPADAPARRDGDEVSARAPAPGSPAPHAAAPAPHADPTGGAHAASLPTDELLAAPPTGRDGRYVWQEGAGRQRLSPTAWMLALVALCNLALVGVAWRSLGTVESALGDVGTRLGEQLLVQTAQLPARSAPPREPEAASDSWRAPRVAEEPEGRRALELAREDIELGAFPRARRRLYSLLCVLDRVPLPEREDMEARARLLVAETWRREAERLEEIAR